MVNRQVNRRDKGGRGGFDYRPSDPKKLKERAERSGGQFDSMFKPGIDMLKPKVGENCYRILPPTFKNPEHFGMSVWVHGWIGPDKASFLCPKKHLGKKCPICDAAHEATDAGEKDEADELKAKEGVIYWVIDRDGDGEPELWKVSNMADKEISGRCEKRSGKILEVDNPWEGHDVIFKRTGQGKKTRYINWELDSDKTALADTDKETNRLLDFVKDNPLDEILKFYPYEYMAASLDGSSAKKDPALDDDDEKPRRGRRGEDEDEKPRGRRNREDDEADDKPRSRRDRDQEEDEKPRGRRGRDEDEDEPRGRGRSRDEDEDEDRKPRGWRSRDDEDDKPRGRRREEEEDEAPRSRSRSRHEEKDPADEDDDRGDDEDDGRRTSKKSSRSRDKEDDGERSDRVRPTRSARTTRDRGAEDEDETPRGRRGSREEEVDDEIPSSRRAKRDRD